MSVKCSWWPVGTSNFCHSFGQSVSASTGLWDQNGECSSWQVKSSIWSSCIATVCVSKNIKNYKDLYDILSAWWNLSVVNDICIVLIDRKSCMRDVYIITGDALIWRTWHWRCCYGFTFFVHNRFLSVFLQKNRFGWFFGSLTKIMPTCVIGLHFSWSWSLNLPGQTSERIR